MSIDNVASPAARSPLHSLSGKQVAYVFVVSLLGMFTFTIGGAFLAYFVAGKEYVAVGLLLGSGGLWAGLWVTLIRTYGWGWRDMGFVPPRKRVWHLLWQIPLALALSLAGAAALGALFGMPLNTDASSDGALNEMIFGPVMFVVFALCSILVVPVAEEILFRRVLLDWARTRMPVAVAVVFTAVLFAAVHVAPVIMMYVVFVGVFAALMHVWYESLWASIALHVVNNSLVVAAVAVTATVG